MAKDIQSGALNLHTVLAMAKIDAKELRDLIGKEKFEKMATKKETESLTVRTFPEVKAQIKATLNLSAEMDAGPSAAAPVAPAPVVQAKATVAAPVAAPSASAESELGDILNNPNL